MGLSRESVIAAGLDVVRDRGWPALSIRAVAAELDVTPMALYRYVANGDDLAGAVMDHIIARMTEVARRGGADVDLAAWAHTARAALKPYPGAATHLFTTWFEMPSVLGVIEDLLAIVHDDGMDGFEAVAAVNAIFMYVLMRAEAEQTIRSAKAVRRSLHLARSHRPLPLLESLAGHYTTAELDRHFAYGLAVLLAGIRLRRTAA